MDDYEAWMRLALKEAGVAAEKDEVPVGALVFRDGELLSKAHNKRERSQSPLAHAEIEAIEKAARKCGSWRLEDCTLVVTLEPCLMCTGAALQARIKTLVFACRDPKAGAVRSLYNCAEDDRLNHRIEVVEGVLADESSDLLSSFFRTLRKKRQDGS